VAIFLVYALNKIIPLGYNFFIFIKFLARDAQAKPLLSHRFYPSVHPSVRVSVRDSLSAALRVASHVDYRLVLSVVTHNYKQVKQIYAILFGLLSMYIIVCISFKNFLHSLQLILNTASCSPAVQRLLITKKNVGKTLKCVFKLKKIEKESVHQHLVQLRIYQQRRGLKKKLAGQEDASF